MIIALFILILLFLIYLIYVSRKVCREFDEFTAFILSKDFSRKYPERGANKRLHREFNIITKAFLDLASEKELQQNYLKEMLELVDTGILAYNIETYQTLWMNDSFATMLNIPHIKNIRWL